MRYESKFWNREKQSFYNSQKAIDLSDVRVLHTGVDTIKQLFNCLLKIPVLTEIHQFYQDMDSNVITLGDIDWQITRSSKQSGYQYILKNLDLGFVVLLKSFYIDPDLNGSHLKIEVSPQTIYENTPKSLAERLRQIAGIFATQLVECGIAAHMCCDVKGYKVPQDFEQRLVAKAKRQFRINNISNVEMTLNDIAAVYGNGQTYTFGSASALQFCLYEKPPEAIKSDKIGFWEEVWQKTPSVEDLFTSEYQQGDMVHRFEMRFHHSIIREFCYGSTNTQTGETLVINDFEDLSKHLTALWQYGLNNFRLQHSSTYIDPMWQLLIEDVEIFPPAPLWEYKRGKKPPTPSSKRNVAFWMGNLIRLMARKRFKVDYATNYILNSGLDHELSDYFGIPEFGMSDMLRIKVREFVENKMNDLWLQGVAV